MIQRFQLLMLYSVVPGFLIINHDAKKSFADSLMDASEVQNVSDEKSTSDNIMGILTIQIPQNGLSDKEKNVLEDLKTIIDVLINTSNLNQMIEDCNKESTIIFGQSSKYYALTLFSDDYLMQSGTASIILLNSMGMVHIKRFTFDNSKTNADFNVTMHQDA